MIIPIPSIDEDTDADANDDGDGDVNDHLGGHERERGHHRSEPERQGL